MADKEREEIIAKVRAYAKRFASRFPADKVPVSGKVFDGDELANAVEAVLDGWWTEGKYTEMFEAALKKYICSNFALTVNSGSSASMVAFYTLTSKKLGERRIRKGDEVITVAAGFPTTVNPIILYGAVPVFVDVKIGTYNIDTDAIERAITGKTKAIFLAHTLGNPFDIEKVKGLADKYGLWLIEDNCDALGSTYNGKKTGAYGHLSTLSFYPAHHITTGEGGAVMTNDPVLYKIARSFRDWGRDCWCPTGVDDTCKKRFAWKLGNLPFGYDHKYIYSEVGFNLKMTEMQAAIGLAQMSKLDAFVRKRKENFDYLSRRFVEAGLEERFVLPVATRNSVPSWFGFPLAMKGNAERTKLLEMLNSRGVATRLIFAGNITKQPYFIDNGIDYRVSGELRNTDIVMEKSFWIGVYPALGRENLDHAVSSIADIIKGL